MIALLTRRAADRPAGDASTCTCPEEPVVSQLCTSTRVSKCTPILRNSSVTVTGRGRTPIELSSLLELSPPSNYVCFGTAFWL